MVEDVKCLHSELQCHLFSNGRLLLERGVDFIITGPTTNVASKIPPRPDGRYRECGRIEPIIDGLVGRINRHAGDQVWTLIPCVAVGQVRWGPVHLDVNRTAAGRRSNPTQLPTAHQLSRNTTTV